MRASDSGYLEMSEITRPLVKYARLIARQHLVMGAMGNISIKEKDVVWIKRGGAWLSRARPRDFIAVDAKSGRSKSRQLPSKEIFLHLGCYKAREDVRAVAHTHPVMSTALATAGVSLDKHAPELCREIGTKTAVIRYCCPGSKRLAAEVRRAIKKTNIVILANHGLVTVGKDLPAAYQRTLACEAAARKILTRLKK